MADKKIRKIIQSMNDQAVPSQRLVDATKKGELPPEDDRLIRSMNSQAAPSEQLIRATKKAVAENRDTVRYRSHAPYFAAAALGAVLVVGAGIYSYGDLMSDDSQDSAKSSPKVTTAELSEEEGIFPIGDNIIYDNSIYIENIAPISEEDALDFMGKNFHCFEIKNQPCFGTAPYYDGKTLLFFYYYSNMTNIISVYGSDTVFVSRDPVNGKFSKLPDEMSFNWEDILSYDPGSGLPTEPEKSQDYNTVLSDAVYNSGKPGYFVETVSDDKVKIYKYRSDTGAVEYVCNAAANDGSLTLDGCEYLGDSFTELDTEARSDQMSNPVHIQQASLVPELSDIDSGEFSLNTANFITKVKDGKISVCTADGKNETVLDNGETLKDGGRIICCYDLSDTAVFPIKGEKYKYSIVTVSDNGSGPVKVVPIDLEKLLDEEAIGLNDKISGTKFGDQLLLSAHTNDNWADIRLDLVNGIYVTADEPDNNSRSVSCRLEFADTDPFIYTKAVSKFYPDPADGGYSLTDLPDEEHSQDLSFQLIMRAMLCVNDVPVGYADFDLTNYDGGELMPKTISLAGNQIDY